MPKRVRVISYAWGDKYVDDFLDLTLPALLADGNVPELARRFEVEFVFLTEERQFARIRERDSWRQLERICPARLVLLDDLVVGHWYGISLSKVLVRGFKDLGADVLNTWLVFLNADFIIADGSYRTVADRIDAGERLIFAPSYCVVREAVLPILRQHVSAGVLSIEPRRMAAIGIPHRHYTIRAKTVNQRLFRIHRYDQFYQYVDERTMIGRQMPIALVAMRPENILEDIDTFWDYGIVTEAAPTARHCVLGDSDEYQMIELRDERTFESLLQLGWPTPDEIARDLSSFTTKDQRDHLGYELIWHSDDLPPNLDGARASLTAFVDDVRRRLSPPVSHLDHPFWSEAIGRFEQIRAEYLAGRSAAQPDPAVVTFTPQSSQIQGCAGEPHAPAGAECQSENTGFAAQAEQTPIAPRPAWKLAARLFGNVPFVTRRHPYWAVLRHAERAIREAKLPLEQARVLLVDRGAGLFERAGLWAAEHRHISPDRLLRDGTGDRTVRFTGNLSVTIEDADGVVRELPASQVSVSERRTECGHPVPAVGEMFDLCLCELDWDDIRRFRDIFAAIRPHLMPGGRIVVLHVDAELGHRWRENSAAIRGCFPTEGNSDVLLSGTAGSRFAHWLTARVGKVSGRRRKLALVGGTAVAALASWAASSAVERQNPHKLGRHVTSLTLIIDLP